MTSNRGEASPVRDGDGDGQARSATVTALSGVSQTPMGEGNMGFTTAHP
jgi:hypothetical protein